MTESGVGGVSGGGPSPGQAQGQRPPVRLEAGALTDANRPASWYRPEKSEETVLEVKERHRREVERRRREWRREQENLAAEAREGWGRVGRTVAILLVLLGVGFAYWKIQLAWGNRWPMMDVWLWAAAGVMAVIWWALRAINKDSL